MSCECCEFLQFRQDAFGKKELFAKIDEVISQLTQQGVLDAILCPNEVDGLNQKMQEYIPGFTSPLTRETAQEYCRNVLVTVVLENVFDKFGKDASDENIRQEAERYVSCINWVQLFDDLLTDSENVLKGFYIAPLNETGVLNAIPDDALSKLDGVLRRVFPLGNPLKNANPIKGEHGRYLSSLILVSEWFDEDFKGHAATYWASRMQTKIGTPFFKVQKMRLDTNFAKVVKKRTIEILTWKQQELSDTIIDAELKEMYNKRPQYLMLIYVALMRQGEEALWPTI